MANQRGTFSKRNREMKLKDRAKEKLERRGVRNSAPDSTTKGPAIAWDQPGGLNSLADDEPAPAADSNPEAAASAPTPAAPPAAPPATPAAPSPTPPPRKR